MAELSDRLNRTVLHLDVKASDAEYLFSDVRLVFQNRIFIDNRIGWIDDVQAELRWYKLAPGRAALNDFIDAAKQWMELSLAELAKTAFTNRWQLARNYSAERFSIEFKPLYHTPAKTDGFTVSLDIRSRTLRKEQEFSSDYTSLVNFIRDLSIDIEAINSKQYEEAVKR